MFCRIELIGNLGRDAELSYTSQNRPYARFSVATQEFDGKKSFPQWHKVVLWGERAEKLIPYLTKGTLVYIEGVIRYREWKGRDGEPRQSLEINARNLRILKGQGSREPEDLGDQDVPF